MSNGVYFPIIKTRDAELKCFNNLSDDTLDKLTPIYELTKSRKTKRVPDGDISRRMKQIQEIQGNRPFILDLCTEEKYVNPQIEQLLSNHNGFSEWFHFVNDIYGELNIIPMIHIYEDEDESMDDVASFVRSASAIRKQLALRLPPDIPEDELSRILIVIEESIEEDAKLIIIFDSSFVNSDNVDESIENMVSSAEAAYQFDSFISDYVIALSSFPSDIVKAAGAGRFDSSGEFEVLEEYVYLEVLKDFAYAKYGDYASINTEQIEIKGGTFVPRIDVLYNQGNAFFYKRYRRDEGGYVNCARDVMADSRYSPDNTWWSHEEIDKASNDKPSGISPSHWISVRMHYYINKKVELREQEP